MSDHSFTLRVDVPQEAWLLLAVVRQFGAPGELERLLALIGDAIPPEVAERPIEELDFPVRIYNLLWRAHIRTTGVLIGSSADKLRSLRLRDDEIEHVRAKLLSEYSIGLAGDPPLQ